MLLVRTRTAAKDFLLSMAVLAAVAGCGDNASEPRRATVDDAGPIHVHGLGVDPVDGALFVATHTGLFRAAEGESRARRVADRYRDTMGFAIVGPGRFLGSGHPDGREQLPPFLGLIESRDAGRSWDAVSLQGEVDFHVLEASGQWTADLRLRLGLRVPRAAVSD